MATQPQLRSGVVVAGTSATSVDITEPAGAASGDLCIAYSMNDFAGNATDVDPTGWTAFETVLAAQGMTSRRWWKVLDGGESWPFTFQVSTASSNVKGGIVCLSPNGGSGWVIDDNGGSPIANATGTVATPNSVTAIADSIYITFYGTDQGNSISSAPSGMTECFSPNHDNSLGMASYYELVGAGALAKALTWGSSDGMHQFGLAISIGAGGGTSILRQMMAHN